MILSHAAQYAVRSVIYLAGCHDGPVLGKEIARELDVPGHFLAKILQSLARDGILRSLKGRGGGFQLDRRATEISLLEVIKIIEGRRFGQDCFLGLKNCSGSSPCALHGEWGRIRDDLLGVLATSTVAQMNEEPELPASRLSEQLLTSTPS